MLSLDRVDDPCDFIPLLPNSHHLRRPESKQFRSISVVTRAVIQDTLMVHYHGAQKFQEIMAVAIQILPNRVRVA